MIVHNFYLSRLFRNLEESIGIFSTKGRIVCSSLEDEKRAVKMFGETRIPAETYEVKFRTAGRLHKKYDGWYPSMHHGMLHIQNIKDFTWVYIHQGLDDLHTAGCPLVATDTHIRHNNRYTLVHSRIAYRRFYPLMAKPLTKFERVLLHVRDETNADIYDWYPTKT